MSPEQAEGKQIDARSDVFSFGSVLYEMVTGRRAFQGESTSSILSAILRDTPTPVRKLRGDVPAVIEQIVNRCLEKNRDARYASGTEIWKELTTVQSQLTVRQAGFTQMLRKPQFAIPMLALLIVIAMMIGWYWVHSSRVRWARTVALPEIAHLRYEHRACATWRLIKRAENYLRGDPEFGKPPNHLLVVRAAVQMDSFHVPQVSNFAGKGATRVGSYRGFSRYEAIAERDRAGGSLFVVRRDEKPPEILGFQADLTRLRNVLPEQASGMHASVALDVDLASNEGVNAAADHPALVRELSPLLPGWRVIVRPHDPGIILKYVTRQRWIYGSMLFLMVTGMVLGVVLVLRDISRERRLSQLRTDFVANVTHELKTPLTSIRMFAETLRMGRVKDAAGQQECLDIIVGEIQRLSRLINTVLDFSKIERGQKQYRMAEVDISEVAQSTLNALKVPLKELGFALEAQIERGVRAVGDADALEQAILNLIDNAIKYSRQNKSVRFNLWTENNCVCLRVTDRGIGIPEAEKNRIFEKFYRARNQLDAGGAGLGLTVVKHIVEAHGGTIEVESKVGEGSSFTVSLPGLPEKPPEKAGNHDNGPCG